MTQALTSLLDLDRYPLDRLSDRPGQALIEACRERLQARGMFNLEGFLRPAAPAAIVEATSPLLDNSAFTHARKHNIYFRKHIDGLADDHPALVLRETVNHTLCADQLANSPLLSLYEWPPFAAFLAAVMGLPALFPMADPLARVNVMGYRAGEALNWHFDRSEFTTTLLLQAPEAGGAFEYRTDLRSDADPNYDGVARLLRGLDPEVQVERLAAGTLNVFRGRNTAHRVTPVEGGRQRIIAVFSFFDRPGVMFSAEERLGFYGRAA